MRAVLLLFAMILATPARASTPVATLVIDCPVAGATVTIDGRKIGKTPLATQALSAGAHTIEVRRLGYLPFTERVDARPGATIRVSADLLPFAGVLKVASDVAGAQVLVDGRVLGHAPGEFEIKIGRRTVAVVAPGHRDHKETLMVSAGNVYEIRTRLAKGESPTAADDLELVPLKPANPAKKRGPTKSAATGRPQAEGIGGDLDLELEPLVPELAAPKPKPAAAKRLEASPAAADRSPAAPVAVAAPLPAEPAAGSGPLTAPDVEPVKPWYLRYWVWGAAGAAVIGSVAMVVALNDRSEPSRDVWRVGVEFERRAVAAGMRP